jgi:hypothetical protein
LAELTEVQVNENPAGRTGSGGGSLVPSVAAMIAQGLSHIEIPPKIKMTAYRRGLHYDRHETKCFISFSDSNFKRTDVPYEGYDARFSRAPKERTKAVWLL